MNFGLGLKIITLTAGVALIATPALSELTVECKLRKVTFSQCSLDQKRCVSVSADEAVQGQFQQIFFMKNPNVTFLDSATKAKKTVTTDSGYFDFASNQLVLLNKQGSKNVEQVYNLMSLNEVSYQGSHGGQP